MNPSITHGEWTDSLLGIVVVERYVAIFKEFMQILFLVDAVGKHEAVVKVVQLAQFVQLLQLWS